MLAFFCSFGLVLACFYSSCELAFSCEDWTCLVFLSEEGFDFLLDPDKMVFSVFSPGLLASLSSTDPILLATFFFSRGELTSDEV